MQVDSISKEDVQAGQTMKHAIGLLAAVAVAAAAGLATVDVPEADPSPRILKRDAIEHGVHPTTSAPAIAAPVRGEVDPALQRPEQGNDHHG